MKGRRDFFLLAVLVFFLLIILGRLTQMQIIWDGFSRGVHQAGAAGNITLDTARGSIFSADYQVLARDEVSYDLAVHYKSLQSDAWINDLANLTGESRDSLKRRADAILSRVDRIYNIVLENTQMEDLRIVEQEQYHPVIMDVSREVAVMVKSAPERYDGIKVKKRTRREYPAGESVPHIVGNCSRIDEGAWERLMEEDRTWTPGMPVESIGMRYRMDDSLGVSGIERRYEQFLRGMRGYEAQRLEFKPFRVERLKDVSNPIPGNDLYLSIRSDFQEALMDVLQEASAEPQLKFSSGSVVVMDVETGAVLAAGTWPSYTREELVSDFSSILSRDRSPFIFRPAQTSLPAGSVYKLFTAIAALEEDVINAGSVFNCQGSKTIHDRRFGCLGRHGRIGLEEAIERSCNVYFYEIALRLSGRQFKDWGSKFGFGQASGIDFTVDAHGRLDMPRSVHGRVNLSIGQGNFQATTLQIVRAIAAIASGRLVEPHFVSYARDYEGNIVYKNDSEGQEINLSDSTLRAVRAGMRRAVHGSSGTARNAGLEEFRAAGKTGTAEQGAGLPNQAWFAGYAPYDNPKVAFAIVSEDTDGQGGGHAAPIMGRILERIWDEIESDN